MSTELVAAIAATPMFSRLQGEDRDRLQVVARLRAFERGDELFAEGDAPDVFHVLVSGRVKITRITPQGRQVTLGMFEPGDLLGAVAVFEGFRYPATASATEPATCLVIPRAAFLALLEGHPSIVLRLLSGLSMRLFELSNRVVELAGGRVEQRLAQIFVRLLAERGQPVDGGILIPLAMSRQELADLSGTTLETTIRVMSRWSKDGVIDTRSDGFLVRDREALQHHAGL